MFAFIDIVIFFSSGYTKWYDDYKKKISTLMSLSLISVK